MAYPNLSAELKRHGMTQTELANRLGRTVGTVSNWMNGKQRMTVADCFRIKEEIFPNSSVDYLFSPDPIDPEM